MGRLLQLLLLQKPELALEPAIAATIMTEGMTKSFSLCGDFTNHSLEDYFKPNKEDWPGS